MNRFAVRVSLALVILLTTAACGADEDTRDKPTDVPTKVITTVEAAVVPSTCWTDEQRVAESSTEEGADVAEPMQWKQAPAMAIDINKTYTATIETNKGSIEVAFYPKDAPNTVNNFVCLARAGYYNNTPIHRIVKGFVIQGGDPTGTGRGGPGYKFADEPIPAALDYTKGTLAMANAGKNTNGSQFFIVLENLTGGRLPKNYTIFGKVTDGQASVDAIAGTPTRDPGTGEKSTPTEPVTIISVTVQEK